MPTRSCRRFEGMKKKKLGISVFLVEPPCPRRLCKENRAVQEVKKRGVRPGRVGAFAQKPKALGSAETEAGERESNCRRTRRRKQLVGKREGTEGLGGTKEDRVNQASGSICRERGCSRKSPKREMAKRTRGRNCYAHPRARAKKAGSWDKESVSTVFCTGTS